MSPVDTTVSFTLAWTSVRPDRARGRAWIVALLLGLMLFGLPVAHSREPELQQFGLQRTTEALYLSARLGLGASSAVQEALSKGVPLYFVWQADVYRKRWYWTNKRVASTSRVLRLAYQPLTRRWRLSVSSEPGANGGGASLQYALHQNHDDLDTALASISRMTRWQVASAAQLDEDEDHVLDWRFRLDLSLLPRPFQIGVSNQSDWDMDIERRLDVPNRIEPEKRPDATPTGGSASEAEPTEAAR